MSQGGNGVFNLTFTVPAVHPKILWPICGQNSQHSTVRRWQRTAMNCKSLDFLGGCNFRKGNTYVFAAPIIRDREVGGSNPLAPTNNSSTYGYLQRWPFLFCGRIVAQPIA